MNTSQSGSDAASLLEAVRAHDPLAIARAITAIENRTATGTELAVALRATNSRCRTVGVTGPPGAGKSSLINAFLGELSPKYKRLAVLTVDPSSPISGGAVLGDRVRMASHSANPDVFIRSLATRGHLGGVTRTTRSVIDLLAAGGMDLIVIETVGTGQSEVEIAHLADVKIVVCAPGLGDEMQAIKAGVLEIADLLVVNKADLPDAGRTAAHLAAMLHQGGHDERRSLLKVSSVSGSGIKALLDAIEARFALPRPAGDAAAFSPGNPRSLLADDVAQSAAAWVRTTADPRIGKIVEDIARGVQSRHDGMKAALSILHELGGNTDTGSLP